MSKRRNNRAGGANRCSDMASLFEARFFRALCDPTRVGILVRLAKCSRACTVSEIAGSCPTDLSVVSRHLATLREAGIVGCERSGKEVYYTVRYPEIAQIMRAMAEAMESCCPAGKESCQAD